MTPAYTSLLLKTQKLSRESLQAMSLTQLQECRQRIAGEIQKITSSGHSTYAIGILNSNKALADEVTAEKEAKARNEVTRHKPEPDAEPGAKISKGDLIYEAWHVHARVSGKAGLLQKELEKMVADNAEKQLIEAKKKELKYWDERSKGLQDLIIRCREAEGPEEKGLVQDLQKYIATAYGALVCDFFAPRKNQMKPETLELLQKLGNAIKQDDTSQVIALKESLEKALEECR